MTFVIALGFFDGVHLGHGALLLTAAERARSLGAVAAATTFDRSPRAFVTGETVPLLTTAEERAALMRERYGIADVRIIPFDRAMMTMPWRDFLDNLRRSGAVHLVAGHDYRFGHRNEGDPDRLRAYCAEHGMGCDVIPCLMRDGLPVSSTQIRAFLQAGDAARAADFLGYPYFLAGKVCRGRGIGKAQTVPTANLMPSGEKLLPADGVYATAVTLPDGTVRCGVTNVGIRPTFSDRAGRTVETFLPDFSADLYAQTIRIAFLARLREERRFPDPAALREQILRDTGEAMKLFVQRSEAR